MSPFVLKFIITVLFIMLFVSLVSGFHFLFKDNGDPGSKRTFYALVIRVSLAVALLATMTYGFYSGNLKSQAPWDAYRQSPQGQEQMK